MSLQRGDAVFVVSDGVAEAMNADDEFFTSERLDADLRGAGTTSAADLVRIVTDHVRDFTGSAPKADDVTALAVRWLPGDA
jgi:serine phosphatase RsbU (regulator of sigma subunit)